MSEKKPEIIDLTTLNLQQLQQLKMEFETELNIFQESLQTLLKCKGKYATSKEALEQIKPDWQDKQILVPLTCSMYVPGVIKQVDNFVIDIGTGYYAEKDLEGSKEYFKRKIDFVQEQVERIDMLQNQKSRFLNAVHDVIEVKIATMTQQARLAEEAS